MFSRVSKNKKRRRGKGCYWRNLANLYVSGSRFRRKHHKNVCLLGCQCFLPNVFVNVKVTNLDRNMTDKPMFAMGDMQLCFQCFTQLLFTNCQLLHSFCNTVWGSRLIFKAFLSYLIMLQLLGEWEMVKRNWMFFQSIRRYHKNTVHNHTWAWRGRRLPFLLKGNKVQVPHSANI